MSKNTTHARCQCGGTCQCGPAEKCTSGKFRRVNYFHGMLLTEEDFVDEQTYLREKLRLHNRLHGAGVVWGLGLEKDCVEVSRQGDADTVTKIFIAGGLALDCAGNEIVVCEKYLVPLDEKIRELRRLGRLTKLGQCEPPTYEGPRLYVAIKYCECKSQPSEQYTSECADDRLRPQYSRVREGFDVRVFTEEELPGRAGGVVVQECPACGGLHPCHEDEQYIVLGYVEGYNATAVDDADHRDARLDYASYANTLDGSCDSTGGRLRWEAQRQNALRAVFRKTDWVDVSPAVGKETADAKAWLTRKGLTPGQVYVPGEFKDVWEFSERVRNSQRWAERGSTVDLVIGGAGRDCILFLLVNRPAADR